MTAHMFSPTSPSGRVLRYVQRHGECSVKELAEGLGVSATAVREPLATLKAEGLMQERVVRQGAGRPLALYSLTPKAQSTFAREYDVLVTLLLREVMAQMGSDRTEEILAQVSTQLAQHYGGRAPGASLSERLAALRATLEQKGIPADVASGELHLFACPYYDVAQEHPAVCAMEQRMLEQLLDQKLVLAQSIRDGHHCCRFAVEP